VATLKEEFRRNKPTWIWRAVALGLLGVIGFLGSWIFTEVSAAPSKFATKVEVRRENDRQDIEIRSIEEKIDEGFEKTQRMIFELHKK